MFSGKGQIIHILGFTGHTVSVIVTQLRLYTVQAATNKKKMNAHGYAPIKPLTRQGLGGPVAHSRRPRL